MAVLDVETGELVEHDVDALAVTCADPIDSREVVVVVGGDDEFAELRALDVLGGGERSLGTLPDGCIINGPAVSPSGALVAVDSVCEDPADHGIWLIPTDGGPAEPVLRENPTGTLWEDAVQYFEPAWSGDSEHLVYMRTGSVPSSIHQVRVDGTGDHEVVPDLAAEPSTGPTFGS